MSLASNSEIQSIRTVLSEFDVSSDEGYKLYNEYEEESTIETDGVTSSIDSDRNSSLSKEPLSSIQELLFYLEENVERNIDFQTNKYNDFMNTEIARESYCDVKKRSHLQLKKLSDAHCICPIASYQPEVNQEVKHLELCHDKQKTIQLPLLDFEVDPYSVLFLNCVPGKTYSKSIKIMNMSCHTQKFEVNLSQQFSPFSMKIILPANYQTQKIATGLSFRILITYVCKGHGNLSDTLRIEGAFVSPILIQIRAYQCPPILSEDPVRLDALLTREAVVSCISCLPSESTTYRVELSNYSETFKFLILDKETWSSQVVDTLQRNNNKLVAGVFTIFPAYFQTNPGASVTITIKFDPKEAGKYCKKLYIVCDNMSVTSMRLIGQAFLFNKSMLKFLNLDKNYCANVNDYIQAKYFLDMGSVYEGRKKTKTFVILNESGCTLHFHWEIHRYPLQGFKKLSSRMIKLTRKEGIFMGNKSGREFSVTVHMPRSSVGEYRTLACLYVDNLSKAKVRILYKNKLLNRSKRRGHSLLIAAIEILVQCKTVQIKVAPQVISLGRIPLLCGAQHKFTTIVTVNNPSPFPVGCIWKNSVFNDKMRVKLEVQPAKATISARSRRFFAISIIGVRPGCFSQYLVCTTIESDCKVDVLVEGKCTMGFLHIRDDFISYGVIKKDTKMLPLTVSFENLTNCKWSRMLSEYRYHSRKSYKVSKSADRLKGKDCRRFPALQFKKRGLYDKGDKMVTFLYNKVNTNIERNIIWCSLLKWQIGDATDYIGVIADIQRPLVTISEIVDDDSEDYLFLNYTSTIRLELGNHSTSTAAFTWCNPIGDQRHNFECTFEPAGGVLQRYEKRQILIHIKPLKMIKIEDLHFICIVKGMAQPLLVSVTGRVQPAIIEFNWQDRAKDTEQHTAVWQSMEENSLNGERPASIISKEEISFTSKEKIDVTSKEKISFTSKEKISFTSKGKIDVTSKEKISFTSKEKIDVTSKEEIAVNSKGKIDVTSKEKISVSGVNPEELSISVPGNVSNGNLSIVDALSVENIEANSIAVEPNNSNVQQNNDFIGKLVVEVDSCHTANKILLQLKNYTRATVSYRSSILHFHPREELISKPVPDAHNYLGWKSLIQPELGVVIDVQNANGQLGSYESCDLFIWAFATSWGIYKDVLKMDADSQLPSIYFELEIICTSNPIHFPALCKPVLRLCAINYLDDVQSYPIRVKNNSSSNILVHWSIHDILDYKEAWKTQPFKLDLWDASENVENWGLTLNPFYGRLYLDTFSVGEPYFRLKAWSERVLTLYVNPRDVKTNDYTKMPLGLNAVLVACVFRDPDFAVTHSNWNQSRMAPVETAHLLIKVNLDKPKMVLLDAKIESLQFIIDGEDLWSPNIYGQSRTLSWQNQSSVSTSALFEIEEPFKIELFKNGVKLMNINHGVHLKHGESIEMLLKLQITDGKEEIDDLVKNSPIARSTTQAEELSGPRVNREKFYYHQMVVSVDGNVDHIYDVKYAISLPKFKISMRRMTFNPVFNGTTKCQTFDIINEDCRPINFQIMPVSPIKEDEDVFFFDPSSGVVASRKVPATISVYFTPRLSIHYRAKFLVFSSIPSHYLQFMVFGHGTYNSKHMGNDFPPK